MDGQDGNMGRIRWTEKMKKSAVMIFSFSQSNFPSYLIFQILLFHFNSAQIVFIIYYFSNIIIFEFACLSTPWLVQEGESVTGMDTLTDIQPFQPHSLFNIIVYLYLLLPFIITKVPVPCYSQ
jgi:hypothetical protein